MVDIKIVESKLKDLYNYILVLKGLEFQKEFLDSSASIIAMELQLVNKTQELNVDLLHALRTVSGYMNSFSEKMLEFLDNEESRLIDKESWEDIKIISNKSFIIPYNNFVNTLDEILQLLQNTEISLPLLTPLADVEVSRHLQ